MSDWPVFIGSEAAYRAHVQATLVSRCRAAWREEAALHTEPVDYLSIRGGVSSVLRSTLGSGLPWSTQRLVRGWCRCCVQDRVLVEGRRMRSKCLFCDWEGGWLAAYSHIFADCPRWAGDRAALLSAADAGWVSSRAHPPALWAVLQATPTMPHFSAAVEWAARVDAEAARRHRELASRPVPAA